jgi:hypothetical protein
MRERLLRWAPPWAANALWVVGMAAYGLLALSCAFYAVDFGLDVVTDGELALLPGTLFLAGAAVVLGRGWWRELQRWREVGPAA